MRIVNDAADDSSAEVESLAFICDGSLVIIAGAGSCFHVILTRIDVNAMCATKRNDG